MALSESLALNNIINMSQVIVTFENGADTSFLRKIIENLKGVLNVSAPIQQNTKASESTLEWINKMKKLSNSVNSSMIDPSDERTQYILSK